MLEVFSVALFFVVIYPAIYAALVRSGCVETLLGTLICIL